jgi:hypothetical protein
MIAGAAPKAAFDAVPRTAFDAVDNMSPIIANLVNVMVNNP